MFWAGVAKMAYSLSLMPLSYMLQKFAKVCKNFCKLLALAYCCSQSRLPNARNTYLFSPLGELAGRATYFADIFSLGPIFYFLMVASRALLGQKLMDRSSPKFQDWYRQL